MAPDNVPPYSRHLLRNSEFPHDSRTICFPLNISEKLQARRGRDSLLSFIFANMIRHPRILKNNINHLSKRE